MVSFNPPHSPYASLEDCMEEDYNLYKDLPLDSLLIRPNANREMKKAPSVRYYFASVTGVDRAFGRILDELKNRDWTRTPSLFSLPIMEKPCAAKIRTIPKLTLCRKHERPVHSSFSWKVIPRIDSELLLSSPDIMPTILGLCGLENRFRPLWKGGIMRDVLQERILPSLCVWEPCTSKISMGKRCRWKSHFLFSGVERDQNTSIYHVTHNRPKDKRTQGHPFV